MKIKIVAVGKKHDKTIEPLINDYLKRLPPHIDVFWKLVPSVQRTSSSEQRQAESDGIRSYIDVDDYTVLLDEDGRLLNNDQLVNIIEASSARTICIIIGGAYGVDDELKQAVDVVWALSRLVFPHQLVRLILAEQLYRTFTIITAHPYHHK